RDFMCHLQVDLLDMHYQPDGSYKYIYHAHDHFSKFSWLSALSSKEAKEVADFLFELFTAFESLIILQTDNGKEFTAQIIRKLTKFWSTIWIINGHPRHPQSQGLIERANDILQQKLSK
ncbi:8774_t:CDS:1, partial [Ambispora gerdemannii]